MMFEGEVAGLKTKIIYNFDAGDEGAVLNGLPGGLLAFGMYWFESYPVQGFPTASKLSVSAGYKKLATLLEGKYGVPTRVDQEDWTLLTTNPTAYMNAVLAGKLAPKREWDLPTTRVDLDFGINRTATGTLNLHMYLHYYSAVHKKRMEEAELEGL